MHRDRQYADDDLVPVGVAARMLGVSTETLRKYAATGLVPVQRTPTNHRRFRVRDVRDVARHATEHATQPATDADDDTSERVRPRSTRRGAA